VIVLDNLSTGFEQALPTDVELVKGSVGDEALVTRIINDHQIEDVIHFAAHLLVPESVQKPFKYYQNNVVASQNLLQVAVNENIKRFIFSSTCAVYGMIDTYPVDESYPKNPISPYGRSKNVTEWTLEDIATGIDNGHINSDFRYVALRYFNVAGARLDGSLGQLTENAIHLIKVCCETILGVRDAVTVFGTDYHTEDGTCVRDYIHVEDLATAHLDALSYLKSGGKSDVFNCGYGQGYSVKQIIDVMKKVSGVDFKVIEGKRREGDPPAIAADNRKIKSALGWTPLYNDIELIAKTALDWEKKIRGN
jgi:UDP-galactose 4-epimerase (EC 5.1.3.2)